MTFNYSDVAAGFYHVTIAWQHLRCLVERIDNKSYLHYSALIANWDHDNELIHYSGIWKMAQHFLLLSRLNFKEFSSQIPSKKTKLKSVKKKLPNTSVKKTATGKIQRQSIAMHIIDENVAGVSFIIMRICSIHDWFRIRHPIIKIIINVSVTIQV